MSQKHILGLFSMALGLITLSGCYYERSGATGWAYNFEANGGFERPSYFEQETGPGLIFVEGGTFTMGSVDDDLNYEWDNIPRRSTVSSFYMDETEVTNHFYLEYTSWLNRVYGSSYPEIVERALPDTAAWRNKLAYNEPMVNYYLRHPAYRDYPVVGVSWLQATEFCKWRSDRVNEGILVREGLLVHNPDAQVDEEHFTTETYLSGQYQGERLREGLPSYSINSDFRDVKMEDGVMLPAYRLPTEAEWEFAALGLIGNSIGELVTERRTYPWNGHFVRNGDSRTAGYGSINANFVKGNGDYMGVAGALDDFGDITVNVYQYAPNDYGLYNMAGNVNEWVMDVYRPLSIQDNNEFRPFRGNVYETRRLNAEGRPVDKYDYVVYNIEGVKSFLQVYETEGNMVGAFTPEDVDLMGNLNQKVTDAEERMKSKRFEEGQTLMQDAMDLIVDSDAIAAADLRKGFSENIDALPGQIQMRKESVEENLNRTNYRVADNVDYLDGDRNSSFDFAAQSAEEDAMQDKRVYNYGGSTMISNRSRVYKGGGWDDRAYYLIPGTRRFLDERQSSASIGFRCAMDRLGTPVPFAGQ
jgi:formylglycine-generating enzyme required for sulfatase activity|tara:strand:- start:571 stop:2325 length:1755 start_codon:yes stop_codon:yes gene_type:complete